MTIIIIVKDDQRCQSNPISIAAKSLPLFQSNPHTGIRRKSSPHSSVVHRRYSRFRTQDLADLHDISINHFEQQRRFAPHSWTSTIFSTLKQRSWRWISGISSCSWWISATFSSTLARSANGETTSSKAVQVLDHHPPGKREAFSILRIFNPSLPMVQWLWLVRNRPSTFILTRYWRTSRSNYHPIPTNQLDQPPRAKD